LYVWGGIVVALALLGVGITTVMGGSGSVETGPALTPRPGSVTTGTGSAPVKPAALRPGVRDPFHALVAAGGSAPAPAATPAPSAPAPAAAPAATGQQTLLEVLTVKDGAASIRVGSKLHDGVKPGAALSDGFVLEAVQGECAFIARSPERFRVCAGERFLK
jgi:hypothetical protein